MTTVTKGAISKSSRPLPPPALAKPSSRWGSNRSKRSGFIHTGKTPSATSALQRMPVRR